jgi:hypothetical protein
MLCDTKDKYTLRWFRADKGFIPIEFGPGNVYAGTDPMETRAYVFKGSSRIVETYIKLAPLNPNSKLIVHSYLIGHRIANIKGSGRVELMF